MSLALLTAIRRGPAAARSATAGPLASRRHCANSPSKALPRVSVELRFDAEGAGVSPTALRDAGADRIATKVSASNSQDALFQDAIDAVRQRRAELDADPVYQLTTDAITKLKQDELALTRKIFKRVDPDRDVTSDMAYGGHDVDPYWNPFTNVSNAREQVTAEFDEYARWVSVAEAKKMRIQIKKSIKRHAQMYNPYSDQFRQKRFPGAERGFDGMPKPFRMSDQFWDPNPLQTRLGKERITWRDVDIIQHFLADNGYILPRRTTMLSRLQQKKLVKAVKGAQRMSLIPYRWKMPDYQAMPLMDPLQWMVDRLTDKVVEQKDRRADAMLKVMVERYPELNFKGFLLHIARKQATQQHAE